MSFLPLPKSFFKNDEQVLDLSPDLLEEKLHPNRHTDNKLQTQLNQDQLDKKLLKINAEAETYYREQGIDILYIALGFLSWYDSDNSDKERKAPLALIPVNLNRSSVREKFKLKYTQVDLGTNLTLKAKLKTDFTIELPDFDDNVSLSDYFKKAKKVIKKQERWKIIKNEIHIGFFKFGKFQMYQDLDAKSWPEDKQPSEHPIIKSLFGEGFSDFKDESDAEILESDILPQLQNLEKFHFIADSDSSQTEAILKIKQGKNLVIQGPPGTGKSQTITNIIAESLSENKKILFVSEKMVALEVVKRRLDSASIGDAVLELHSHKSNKKVVLEELKRTLDLGKPKTTNRENQISRYKEVQKRLDDYRDAIQDEILDSKKNFVQAVGYLSRYKTIIDKYNLSKIQIPLLEKWSEKKFLKSERLINHLIVHINEYGSPSKNCFSKSKIDHFSPDDKSFVEVKLSEIISDISNLKNSVSKLLELIPLKVKISLFEIDRFITAINHLESIPEMKTVDYESNLWIKKEIKNLLENGLKIRGILKQYSDTCIEAAFDFNVINLRKTFLTKGCKWWKFLSSEYREAKNTLRGLLKSELPSTSKPIEIIDAILNYQESKKIIQKNDEVGNSLYGEKWKGIDSNWDELENIFDWLRGLYTKIDNEEISKEIPAFLGNINIEKILEYRPEISTSVVDLTTKLESLHKKIKIEDNHNKETYFRNVDLDLLKNQMENMQKNTHQLFEIGSFNVIKEQLLDNDLEKIVDLGYSWTDELSILLELFRYSYYNSLASSAHKERDAIKNFDKASHFESINEFRDLDEKLFHYARETLILNHYKNLPVNALGEMGEIRLQINKKRGHLPIRQLLSKAGNAIQQIKPVFMMSPMSVSTFLNQGTLEFDLVIFDEASQVKVVDALIPILRGKQIVVVGDSKQMPPSDFFSRTFENEENEDENVTGDIESILGMFLAQGANESMLKWHYRSRHDSLINVSNQKFYEGRLMVFPSSGTDEKATGLKSNHIPKSIYERGSSRTNPIEARELAEAVMKHAKVNPKLTLGVVAFSKAQSDCILMKLEHLRREDPSCEEFFSRTNVEDFFVKNLENVQGDERDVIFISIGYGRTAHGKVTSSFGLVNKEGGERRLNVLITRARLGMEVFCNFTADDLETKSTTPFGMKALKSFLKYAETGSLEKNHETGKETDSPFEDEVISAIVNELGYEVEPQVGSAGFFIDIAVKDPVKPGKYILAVECDGASYHSSASARDRDRLRQNILESMGWKFHRIWSTDWFRSRDNQIELLKIAIEKAVQSSNTPIEKQTPIATKGKNDAIPRNDVKSVESKSKKYKVLNQIPDLNRSGGILEMSTKKIAEHIDAIISYEGAIHIKDVAKRITDAYGVGRVGKNIFDCIYSGANYGHKKQWFYFKENILYKDKSKKVEIRERSDLSSNLKHIEHIPKEELQQAIINTIEMAFSIKEQEVISDALSLIGFNRATEKASDVIKKEIKNLLTSKKIRFEQEKLMLNQDKEKFEKVKNLF